MTDVPTVGLRVVELRDAFWLIDDLAPRARSDAEVMALAALVGIATLVFADNGRLTLVLFPLLVVVVIATVEAANKAKMLGLLASALQYVLHGDGRDRA